MNEQQVTNLLDMTKTEINSNRNEQFLNLERRLSKKIKNLEQLILGGQELSEDLDHIQPYDRDISQETSPQLSSANLKKHNDHITHLSNHELHQVESIHEKDHRKPIQTILDEPLGVILDNTINFLVYSIDNYHKKLYEAELMENIHGDDKGFINTFKTYLIASVLFFRDDKNIIYIGLVLIFLSIIIYFINIITIQL